MAFTESQKVKIRKYLGWGPLETSDTTLESAIGLVGLNAAAQTEVESILSNIAVIEAKILGLHPIALADKVEESSLNPHRYRDLRAAGRREVVQLSVMMMNTPIRRDVFASGSTGGSMRMG